MSYYSPIYEQAFSQKSSTFVGDATLKPSSPKYWGEVRYQLELPQGTENNLHVLVSEKTRESSVSARPRHRGFVSQILEGHMEDPFYLMMNYDSIAATLTGFITFTMFLMCSNPMTITPMR